MCSATHDRREVPVGTGSAIVGDRFHLVGGFAVPDDDSENVGAVEI